MRVAKTTPAVAVGQAVPVVLPNGRTLLVAEARASAEWTLEALKPGTHTIGLQIRATYKAPGQPDMPLKGTAQAAVVVTDPRFQINFTHPDTVREGEEYTAYAFVTNLSSDVQTVALDTQNIPPCSSGTFNQNIGVRSPARC